MRYPEFLGRNCTIGVVAPSFGCTSEPYASAFKSAIEFFEQEGKNVKIGHNVYKDDGVGISSTPDSCGDELTQMYCDESTDVLLSAGGGELMCEILEYVDFEKIGHAKPKWFGGYSDNTNFIFLNTIINDVAGIYAPCAGAFGMRPFHTCMNDYYRLLTYDVKDNGSTAACGHDAKDNGSTAVFGHDAKDNESTAVFGHDAKDNGSITFSGYDAWEKESLKSPENPLATVNATQKSVIKAYVGERLLFTTKSETEADMRIKEDKSSADCEKSDCADIRHTAGISFTGRIIGGCMDVLVNLLGTKYDKVAEFNERYKDDGIIWFLESCDLNVFAIRRAVWQMDNAGWFKNVKGFVIGRPLCMGQEMMGLDQYKAVTGIIGRYDVPIIMDTDIGHVSPSMPVVCGSVAKVNVSDDGYSMTYYFT